MFGIKRQLCLSLPYKLVSIEEHLFLVQNPLKPMKVAHASILNISNCDSAGKAGLNMRSFLVISN